MNKAEAGGFLLLFFLAGALPLRADRITLVDGVTGTGTIVQETGSHIVFVKDGAGQRVAIPRRWVRSIERGSGPAPAAAGNVAAAPSPPGPAASPAQFRGVRGVTLMDGSVEWQWNGINIELHDEIAPGAVTRPSPFPAGQWVNPYPSGMPHLVKGFVLLGAGLTVTALGLLTLDALPIDVAEGKFLNPVWVGAGLVLAASARITIGATQRRIHVQWDERHGT